MVASVKKPYKRKLIFYFLSFFTFTMAANVQDYSPINSLQKMVDNIPNGNGSSSGSQKKHKKHKKKENMPPPLPPPPPPPPPPSTLPQLQTTPDFAPNDLLKEMGFDISPTTTTRTSSNSTVSPTSLTTTMDEKKYDLNICLFPPINLELFQAISNREWYVKCPFSRECGVFAHRTMQNAYMCVLNRKVHDTYRNLKGTVMCECNSHASLRVSESPSNPGRPFFGCRNRGGCRFFQWADVGFTKKNEELQKLFKEYGRF